MAWLCEEAARQPVLVMWEDLHWLDPSSVEWLTLLMDQIATARLLLLLTARLEFRPPWGSRAHLTQLALPRFTRPQVEELVLRITGGKRLPAEVVQQVIGRTDGVPLFVEELTKMVLESEWLAEGVEQYELTSPLPSRAIPATLEGSLLARLDRLPTAKEVAQWGATIGRQFTYEQLQAVAPWDAATLQHELTNLVAAELLFVRGEPPQATYVFKHALIRDAAYQSLLRRTRQQIHQRIAHVWETQFPESCALSPELVAHHYTEAGLHAQALPYWQRAGQHAIARSANSEAVSHFTQGLALLKTLPDTPERPQHELALHMALGPALMATKGQAAPEVEQAYARALALCQQVGPTSQLFWVMRGLWNFYLLRSELQTAHGLAEQLLSLAQHLHNADFLLRSHQALGITLFWRGEFARAQGHLEQGIALYSPQRHDSLALHGFDAGIVCLSYATLALWCLGYADQALQRSHEARTLAHELSHPSTLTLALHFVTILHQFRHEAHAAQEQEEAVLALCKEQGFRQWLAEGPVLWGWALAAQGQAAEGLAQMRQGLAAQQAIGAELARPYFLALLAEGYGNQGQVEAGLAVLAEALALVHTSGERMYEAELYRLKGELLRQQAKNKRQHAKAEACLRQALVIARRQEAKGLELRAAKSLCRLWQQQGKQAEAQALLAPVYNWFTEGLDTADFQEAKVLWEELRGEMR